MRLRSVIHSHPHQNPNSLGTAAALERGGFLAACFTGLASCEGGCGAAALAYLSHRWPALRNRVAHGVTSPHLRSLALVEATARVFGVVAEAAIPSVRAYDSMFVLHDAAVARLHWPASTSMVYAYEDGALRTFRRARQLGVTCVWDLPTGHYPVVEEVWRNEARRWPTSVEAAVPLEPPWKKRRKDLEFALADIVSVASGFVRDSVQRQDPRKHVMVTPYGFPVEEFQARQTPPPGPFTVLSVGVHSVRKGSHYLLEAWRRAGIRDARLRIIGPLRLSTSFLSGYTGLFEHVPYVPRAHLGAEYRAADLLAFPTLCDGFGLVIQESMCCGTPVIATPCSGGPECITDGEDGWVVPARDMEALVDRFRTAAADRDRLFRMGQRARKRAERWTWLEAGAKLIESLGGKGP